MGKGVGGPIWPLAALAVDHRVFRRSQDNSLQGLKWHVKAKEIIQCACEGAPVLCGGAGACMPKGKGEAVLGALGCPSYPNRV